MMEEIHPVVGEVAKNGHLRIGYYNQHSEAQLDLSMSPLEFLPKKVNRLLLLAGAFVD